MKRLIFSGGFHNSPSVGVMVPEDKLADFDRGLISRRELLTGRQQKRLDCHFCGIKGCKCGGLDRAEAWHKI